MLSVLLRDDHDLTSLALLILCYRGKCNRGPEDKAQFLHREGQERHMFFTILGQCESVTYKKSSYR